MKLIFRDDLKKKKLREQWNLASKKYYKLNLEKIKEYRRLHPEIQKKGSKKYYWANKKSIQEKHLKVVEAMGGYSEWYIKFGKKYCTGRPTGKHLFPLIGEKNPSWCGGKSFEPYSTDWTKTLKRSIRERDGYECRICGKPQSNRNLSIHHIDYDKKNCNPTNLISLCLNCHTKTNHKRDFWLNYFVKLME
jgi:5-methylcytosine-specific restriction endonuclease McrA